MSNPGDGGCQCGAVRFAVQGEPSFVYACHCRECRRQSASAFGISVLFDPAALRLLRGAPSVWSRATASGGTLDCAFCPNCGSRLWHQASDCVSVKGGALDDPPAPQAHIWVSRKLPWVLLPEGIPSWPEEPPE